MGNIRVTAADRKLAKRQEHLMRQHFLGHGQILDKSYFDLGLQHYMLHLRAQLDEKQRHNA
jgi:hypothetical protein